VPLRGPTEESYWSWTWQSIDRFGWAAMERNPPT
jgi:hypothetical protein